MSIDRSNTEANENNQPNHRHIETDSEKIVHRHLQNKDDVITDEDIRNIRVGLVNEPEITGAAIQEPLTEISQNNEQEIEKNENSETPGKDATTPWDAIE